MRVSNKQKFSLALLLLLFAVIKIVALFWWQNDQNSAPSQPVRTIDCNIRSSCILSKGVTLTFKGTVSTRVPFEIVLEGINTATDAFIYFEMVGMEMGFNRYQLIPNPNRVGQMIVQSVRLPVCVSKRKDYLAILSLNGQRYQIAFSAN